METVRAAFIAAVFSPNNFGLITWLYYFWPLMKNVIKTTKRIKKHSATGGY